MYFASKKSEGLFRQVDDRTQQARLAIKLAEGLTNTLGATSFVTNWGPFAAIAALTGYGDVRGACDRLDDLMASLPSEVRRAKDKEDAAEGYMRERAAMIEDSFMPVGFIDNDFIDACQAYSVTRFDRLFLSNSMKTVLELTRRRLQEFNDETFEVYAKVMDTLQDTLNHDAESLVEPHGVIIKKAYSYGTDAYRLNTSTDKLEAFKELFSSNIDSRITADTARQLAQSMLGEGCKGWQLCSDNPAALATEVRRVFDGLFRPFRDSILEKFAVMAYADPEDMGDVTIERLNQIWDAASGTREAAVRDNAISSAGSAIARMLEEGSAPLVELEGGDVMLRKGFKRYYLTLLRSMTRLNPAIVAGFTDPKALGIGYIGDDSRPVIRCSCYVGPIALPFVKGASSWARSYQECKGNPWNAGHHLCEVGDWARLLPEPCGMDMGEYWKSVGREGLVTSASEDVELYERIRSALERGMEDGRIAFVNGLNPNTACFVLRRVMPDGTVREVPLVCNNAPLQARQQEVPSEAEGFSNLCRIVRSSIRLQNELFLEIERS